MPRWPAEGDQAVNRSIEQRVLDTISADELRNLAAWARLVPKELLTANSPNAAKFERMAKILDQLAALEAELPGT